MKLDAYLDRIAYQGPLRADHATLVGLHRAHLLAIPYENLDVQLGRPGATDPSAAYDKIVLRKRGGWCYEMNGLFGWALGEIGFKVTRATGAVMREQRGEVATGNHLVLKVELGDGVFLADVGYGNGPLEPIPLAEGEFVSQGFGFYLSRLDDTWWRLHCPDGMGSASFDFNLAAADEALLARQCHDLQSSPESPFVLNAVLQRHFVEGIWQLRGRILRKLTPIGHNDYLVESAQEYAGVLSEIFGLAMPDAPDLWPKICARHDAIMAEKQTTADELTLNSRPKAVPSSRP